jgi:hypothetical protein
LPCLQCQQWWWERQKWWGWAWWWWAMRNCERRWLIPVMSATEYWKWLV